jgi:hypothetical protein
MCGSFCCYFSCMKGSQGSASAGKAPSLSKPLMQQLYTTGDTPLQAATGLDRSQELYTWAYALVTIWPGGVVAAPTAAGVVSAAAAQVAACHLQCMADMERVNAILTKQRRRTLAPPRLGGVAAAVELGKAVCFELVTYIPGFEQQQQQQQPPQSQSPPPQQQQQPALAKEVDFPVHVQQLLDSYQQLLPLCATSMAFDGLQLVWLMEMKQKREQQRQKQQALSRAMAVATEAMKMDIRPAEWLAAAAAAAAAPAGDGSTLPAADTCKSMPALAAATPAAAAALSPAAAVPLTTVTAAVAAAAAADTAAAAAAASTTAATGTDTAAAAAAAAAAAEHHLLRCAQRLHNQLPPWLSAVPGWAQLLQGSWQDMGYPLELQDEVNWRGGALDDSSSDTSDAGSSDAGSSGSSSSSNRTGSTMRRLRARFEAAYSYCFDK